MKLALHSSILLRFDFLKSLKMHSKQRRRNKAAKNREEAGISIHSQFGHSLLIVLYKCNTLKSFSNLGLINATRSCCWISAPSSNTALHDKQSSTQPFAITRFEKCENVKFCLFILLLWRRILIINLCKIRRENKDTRNLERPLNHRSTKVRWMWNKTKQTQSQEMPITSHTVPLTDKFSTVLQQIFAWPRTEKHQHLRQHEQEPIAQSKEKGKRLLGWSDQTQNIERRDFVFVIILLVSKENREMICNHLF